MAQTTPQTAELEVRTQPHASRVSEEMAFPDAAVVLFPLGVEQPVEGDDEATDPRADGACLFDLSSAEWRFVRNAPLVGFLLVAGADGTVSSQERRTLLSALEAGKNAPSTLFRTVCRELLQQRDRLTEIFVTDTFERDQLAEAYSLMSGKLGAEEAEQFRACLLQLGRDVARSSGGLLASWGWLRGVEKRALVELSRGFGPRLS